MTRPFATVCVIGLGTLGSALADMLARDGRKVIGVDDDETPLPSADLVVEAVPERLDQKIAALRRADAACSPQAVFATTTTGLSVTEIAANSGRMERTVGLHLCDAGSGTAVELVRTPVTEEPVRRAVTELVGSLGLTPVEVHDHPGFVGGGLLLGYLNAAARMYEQGYVSRDDIDTAMTLGCGLPAGPLATLDTIGLDVAADSLTALFERTGEREYAPARILSQMADAGLLGRKSGRGFYTYESTVDERVPARPERAPGRAVRRIGVVGSGTMASGIAEVCARAGYPTTLVARTETRAKEALTAVERSLERGLRRRKMTDADVDRAMERLTGTDDLGALGDCDLVTEAIIEELTAKRAVFSELGRQTTPGTVLATTTSSLSVTECATASDRPEDVIGMHFFNPAPIMRLVEVARSPFTSAETLATAVATVDTLGKTAVTCSDRTGFIVNALLFPYLNRAATIARERHIHPETVDTVMTGAYGYPMGPFQLLDVIGLDVSLAIQERLEQDFGEHAPARYLTDLVQAGRLGRKVGRGFHVYPER
jgi:3-hydroxybutyryl-CoA dehydrogenase